MYTAITRCRGLSDAAARHRTLYGNHDTIMHAFNNKIQALSIVHTAAKNRTCGITTLPPEAAPVGASQYATPAGPNRCGFDGSGGTTHGGNCRFSPLLPLPLVLLNTLPTPLPLSLLV